MPRSMPLTQIKPRLVVDLEKSPLLKSLTPEQLNAMVRHCRVDEIDLKDVRKPLEHQAQFIIIIDGVFESVFFPDIKAVEYPELAVVLDELHPGDVYGEHYLFKSKSSERTEKVGLRPRSKGRIVRFSIKRIKSYMQLWPSLKQTLLEITVNRNFEYSLRLGDSMAQLYHSDLILNRIESVADLLIDSMTGEIEQKAVIQQRFKFSSYPNIKRLPSEKKRIEQAYLSVSGNKEDRIRKEGDNLFIRTTKFGTGATWKVFQRKISKEEYNDLLKNRIGEIIIKEREYLKENPDGTKIIIDRFKGEMMGLIIAKIDFDSMEVAEDFVLPDYLQIGVKEITEDKRYSNQSLALKGLPE